MKRFSDTGTDHTSLQHNCCTTIPCRLDALLLLLLLLLLMMMMMMIIFLTANDVLHLLVWDINILR